MNYFSQLVIFLILYTLSNSNYQKSLLFSIIIDLYNTNYTKYNNKISTHIKTHFNKNSDIINKYQNNSLTTYNHFISNKNDINQPNNADNPINYYIDSSNNTSTINNSEFEYSKETHISNNNIFDNSINNYKLHSSKDTSAGNYINIIHSDDIPNMDRNNITNQIDNPVTNHNSDSSKYTSHDSTPNSEIKKKNNENNINNYDNPSKHSNDKNSISNNKYCKEKVNLNKKDKYIIISSIKQVKESDTIKVSKVKNIDYTDKQSIHSSKVSLNMVKPPFLIGRCHIKNIFKGYLNFSHPINDIIVNSNKIIIKENYLLADNFMGMSSVLFYLEGYLKTNFYTLEAINSSKQMINSIYKDNIIYTPFTISKYLNIGSLLENEKYLFKNSELNITNFTCETTKELLKVNDFSKDSNSYNNCNITISLNYSLNIYNN